MESNSTNLDFADIDSGEKVSLYLHPWLFPIYTVMFIHVMGWFLSAADKLTYKQYSANFLNPQFLVAMLSLGTLAAFYSLIMFDDVDYHMNVHVDKQHLFYEYPLHLVIFVFRVLLSTLLADLFIWFLHFSMHHHLAPRFFRKTHKTHHKKFYSSLTSLDGLNSELIELMEFTACLLFGSYLMNSDYLEIVACGIPYVCSAIYQHGHTEFQYFNYFFNDGHIHWLHHKYIYCNFATISPIWDKLFGTFINPYDSEKKQLAKLAVLRKKMMKC